MAGNCIDSPLTLHDRYGPRRCVNGYNRREVYLERQNSDNSRIIETSDGMKEMYYAEEATAKELSSLPKAQQW